jgi:hypothetical protein
MKLPQLSLRDLFWLVLVVGMGLGWSLTALGIRVAFSDRVGIYMDGYMDGQSRLSGWWVEKMESTTDPESRELIKQYLEEQPRGGMVDVPKHLFD